jgi:uncharacterized protein (UPF0261 family)
MVNFLGRATVPPRFEGRTFHVHNENVTLMRTTPEECAAIGRDIGAKLSAARGPAALFLPLQGVSAIDRAGQPFDDPAARTALLEALRDAAPGVERHELDLHLNDPAFAEMAARRLIELIRAAGGS